MGDIMSPDHEVKLQQLREQELSLKWEFADIEVREAFRRDACNKEIARLEGVSQDFKDFHALIRQGTGYW